MSFLWLVWVAIAVALGVNWGLKIHENPESFNNLLGLIWSLLKLLLIICVILGVVWGAIYWLRWFFEKADSIDTPERLDNTIGIIILILTFWMIIWWWILWVKEKWWLKNWWKNHKDNKKKVKQAQKNKIAKMSKEELKAYKKSKRPWIRFRLLIAFPAFILIAVIIGLIKLLISNAF